MTPEKKADRLVTLARESFPAPPLTDGEVRMLRAAALGKGADLRSGNTEADKPENAAKWVAGRAIRSGLIRWLCSDAQAARLVAPVGIQVRGARVEGLLDLSCVRVPFRLGLFGCAIPAGLDLLDAALPGLSLDGSHTGAIGADRLHVAGSLFLRAGFHASGEVRLLGARVGGNLDCYGGVFEGAQSQLPDGTKTRVALRADGIQVGGYAFLREHFHACGEVRLLGARVGGDLSCSGGAFENPGGDALIADGVEVRGAVFLRKGFSASGVVRLLAARVGRDLDCSGGVFEGAETQLSDGTHRMVALSADGIEVRGSVFLRESLSASGQVRLAGARIGGNLECRGGTFKNAGGDALFAQAARVTDGILLDCRMEGTLSLNQAHARVLVDNPACWPGRGRLVLDGFTYEAIEGTTEAGERLDWLERQYPESPKDWRGTFRPQPYDQLARVLRQMGHEGDARDVLVGKHKHLRRYGRLSPVRLLWDRFLGFAVGHGHKVWRLAYWFLAFFLAGTLVFWQADRAGLMASVCTHEDAAADEAGRLCPWAYSLDVLLPIVNLHQEESWRPDPSRGARIPSLDWDVPWAGRAVQCYFWSQILFGWGLTTLLVAALTGIIRRE